MIRSKRPAQPIQGLIDGLEVLQTLTVLDKPASVKDISEMLNMEKTKVNRLLRTLSFLGYTYQDSQRRYIPGAAVHVLAAHSLHASKVFQIAFKYIEPLLELDCVVAIGVLWNNHVSYLYHWSPGMSTMEAIGKMAVYPLEKSSIGQILLAHRDEVDLDYVVKDLKLSKEYTDQLKIDKENGYSVIKNEKTSIAVRVNTADDIAIALSDFDGNHTNEEVVELLKKTTLQIQSAFQAASGR
ncbi:helix-turn-helix domain-containing protein [Flammeovirga sp. SJP92]|uniref:helix-turn-helix domain-containing protein n=1 Tax=Flammeovirga sp. SJP92 TaxID=1775430 RepID=UPI000786E940|nr:helix-turn-helix domain-containing protein [Flammeovirga sp. SJP92]KXX69298.1 hypothetical protein AVL50_19995 [Flammeovirga sp. SJP92]